MWQSCNNVVFSHIDILSPAYFIPQTGLTNWTDGLSWKQLLNNNPGIIMIHLLERWRHHYRATTAGIALSYKSQN